MKTGKITPELRQKIKESVNLREIVGEHVVLRKSGRKLLRPLPVSSGAFPLF